MVASVEPIVEYPFRHADQFFKMLDRVDRIHQEAIRQSLFRVGRNSRFDMFRELTTGARSGRFYRYGSLLHQASAPGEFPARLTGKLAASTRYVVRGSDELEVGSQDPSIPYPEYLEGGTRKMKRRPFIEPISNRWAQELAIILVDFSRTALSKGRGTRL